MEKIQAEIGTLRSENETLHQDLTVARSNTVATIKSVLTIVARRLEMDDTEEHEPEENAYNEEPPIGERDTTTDDRRTDRCREERHDDDREEHDVDRERRRSRRKTSMSRNDVPKSVKKELKELREMIQRISGVPKPLDKATPTSYADFPFFDSITLVEMP